MPMDDLYTALNMFKDGVNHLQTVRAIDGANQQVQDIKASAIDDAQKRSALTDVSNQLVTQMSALGAPVDRIQETARALAPKNYANANAMAQDAVMGKNTALLGQAQQLQNFEANPKFELAKIKAARSPFDDMMKMKQYNEAVSKETAKELETAVTRSNPDLAVRNSLGANQRVLNKIGDAEALLHGDPSKLSRFNLEELPRIADTLLSGGNPTQGGAEHLRSNSFNIDLAKAEEYAGNGPVPTNVPGFVDQYGKLIDRVKGIATNQTRIAAKNTFKTQALSVAKRDPEAVKAAGTNLLGKYGDAVSSVDPKSGKITFQSDEEADKLKQAMWDGINSNHPQLLQGLQAASENPFYLDALHSDPKLARKVQSIMRKGAQ